MEEKNMPATAVKSKWVAGNLVFYDSSGTAIFTIDGANGILSCASGKIVINGVAVGPTSIADVNATAAEMNMAADNSANTELVTATNVILAAESGTTYFLNSATEFVSTLPAPALGLRFSFIVKAAPSGASYTIVTNASGNIIKGHVLPADGAAGDTETAGGDTISFVDGQAVAGDRVDLISDGTYWYATGRCAVAAAITITTAS
jgi:hypothetical protein